MKNPLPRPPALRLERDAWASGQRLVAGVDEAGRGPLAGPVVAGAVCIAPDLAETLAAGPLVGLTDSKQLTALQRERFFAVLTTTEGIRWSVAEASVQEIDSLNILRATHLAMRRAVERLNLACDLLLVDGRPVQGLPYPSKAVVDGDALSFLIGAASILAKVTRDRIMHDLDRAFPQYGFAGHKGYGTKKHLDALSAHGPCVHHRTSFAPVRERRLPLA